MFEDEAPPETLPLEAPPLIKVRARRKLRTIKHWVLFSLSCLIGFTPAFAGFTFGAIGLVGSIQSSLVPLWVGFMGVGLIIACLLSIIIVTFGIVEAHDEASWWGLGLALTAWPGVIVAALLMTVTAAPTGTEKEQSPLYAITIEDIL